jgi:hypothetical protein
MRDYGGVNCAAEISGRNFTCSMQLGAALRLYSGGFFLYSE